MKTQMIREKFLTFFEERQHTAVPSSSLIPSNDPTLLFVNSGMVQFKEVFLGREERPYRRATSIQRSVRAGGKHNDLDNVGFTARHHTFFEMLGNFSFGDYFKREAIFFAWEFLTVTLKLPADKLWITVYEEDAEAESIWLNEVKVDPTRFSRIGAKDNFWAMGDTGPCGPCTEIFYDHGAEVAGGPPGSPEADGDRYIEIWNLVFMQFNRDKEGNLTPLPKPCVDTGMGLERLAAILQGVHDNYDIDLFKGLIAEAAKLTNATDLNHRSLRVIADHIRSTAFLILDGVNPSNEGRGYVLRRIMRRAIRHGHKLGATGIFFSRLIPTLVHWMGEAYPELKTQQTRLIETIQREEIQFSKTLAHGLKEFESAILNPQNLQKNVLSGELVFKLYDTYGFPVDLTEDMAKERGISLDHAGFELAMEAQRSRAKEASQFGIDYTKDLFPTEKSQFTGYFSCLEDSAVAEIFKEGRSVSELVEGEEGVLVLKVTPFYAESGGQKGDTGKIQSSFGDCFEVRDTQKKGDTILHLGVVTQGRFEKAQTVQAEVTSELRNEIKRHHSATHLLQAALHAVVGTSLIQKGSSVTEDRLRFDFSHTQGLTIDQIEAVERWVNQKIQANHPVVILETSLKEAQKMGAMALFGEKYAEESVRVIQMGLLPEHAVSVELCGGTHVSHTGDIGAFKIVSETAIASGVRRIEAVAGNAAIGHIHLLERALREAADLLKSPMIGVSEKLKNLLEKQSLAHKTIEKLEKKIAGSLAESLLAEAVSMGSYQFLAKEVDVSSKNFKELFSAIQHKLPRSVLFLGAKEGDRLQVQLWVSSDLTQQFHAGKLIAELFPILDGKGGGKAEMAQASGLKVNAFSDAASHLKNQLLKEIN